MTEAGPGPKTVIVDLSVTPLAAVQRAGYALADRYIVDLERQSDNTLTLSIAVRSGGSKLPADDEVSRLLLDFALRVDIEERTRDVRTLLVKAALSNAR